MKISREDWFRAGLSALADGGPEALKIDRLCRQLAVTKGSFYHYFSQREAFIDELLAFWRANYTQALIAALSPQDPPHERAAQLSEAVAKADHPTEVALRSWALSDSRVAKAVAEVDSERLDFITALLAEVGYKQADSELLAKLLYAQTLGCQQLGKRLSANEWKSMDSGFMRWLIREEKH